MQEAIYSYDLQDASDIETRERQYGDLTMTSLIDLTSEETESVKKRIAEANGTVQLWIHSHYDENEDSAAGYKQLRDKAISASNTNRMPVIAFIETPLDDDYFIDQYGHMYSELLSGQVFFIPTFQDTSVPCILAKDDILVTNQLTEVLNWDYTAELLGSLGVKKVIVRGRNFEYTNISEDDQTIAQQIWVEKKGSLGSEAIPDKCAGAAVVQLEARGFKVLPSRVTYPEQLVSN